MIQKCKRCGKKLLENEDSLYWHPNYCKNCLNEFSKAEEEGAIIVRRRIQRQSNIFPYEIAQRKSYKGKMINAEVPEGINQVKAIRRALELRLDDNQKIIFNYEPHMTMWFLEEYLEAHPKIKEDVEKPSLFQKLFRKKS